VGTLHEALYSASFFLFDFCFSKKQKSPKNKRFCFFDAKNLRMLHEYYYTYIAKNVNSFFHFPKILIIYPNSIDKI